jgi:hypothetical protein
MTKGKIKKEKIKEMTKREAKMPTKRKKGALYSEGNKFNYLYISYH